MKDAEKAALRVTERVYYEEFRERLRARRVAMERSQEDMARALGIPKSTYEKLEQRDRFPLYLIEKLAFCTDLPVEFWVTGRVKMGQRPVRVR
jgi:transcriptional regulator with XRE-family HTH domain